MEALANARVHQKRPLDVRVPDLLWRDRGLTEGARYLWCFLWMTRTTCTKYTFAELRRATGLSQHSLLRHLEALSRKLWLQYTRSGRTVEVQPLWPRSCRYIVLTDDLLLDRSLPHAARWVWGVIRRLGRRFSYQKLIQLTGYCHNSLTKYLRVLQEKGHLTGTTCRVGRRKAFDLTASNPAESRRLAALAKFEKSKSLVQQWRAYSFGQFLLARMVEMLTGTVLLENGAASCLDNPETGARMQFDLFLPKYSVALEFQGPQHSRVTQRFPDAAELQRQQQRDRLKRQLSEAAGIRLIEVHPPDLSFVRLSELLRAAGVPLRDVPDEERYVYQALLRHSERYRAAVRQEAAV
ncbi:hypothetical protein [Symbiobacterium thermophilum]|uniref:Uncharacterized protein n=1 Tax=Symbiobacterium thermophilum TaxID=2734 RepID=A0A953LHL5_SYMTR|nr:hypothetical protein [Symbiobacterium thermophilum]MBY6277418.1 hypothetical protein [Symbiobacterium thermophilum]